MSQSLTTVKIMTTFLEYKHENNHKHQISQDHNILSM